LLLRHVQGRAGEKSNQVPEEGWNSKESIAVEDFGLNVVLEPSREI
jgi:hypothetical protein